MEILTATLICGPFCNKKVASVSLLDRMVISVHRAGFQNIIIVGKYNPESLIHTHRLGIHYENITDPTPYKPGTLLANTDVLITKLDIENLLFKGGRLHGSDNSPLPVGIVESSEGHMDNLRPLLAQGPCKRIQSTEDLKTAETLLWNSIESSADGWVDLHFNRPVGRPLSRFLVKTSITPNQVTLFALILGCLAAGSFAIGSHLSFILGAVLLQLSAVLDCIDGDVARIKFRESPLGKWLDLISDQIVHAAVFAGIAIGVYRQESDPIFIVLGLSCVIGVVASFFMVLKAKMSQDQNNPVLSRFLDRAANRDFSVLVILLAIPNCLDLFVWACGIGIHAFWMLLFVIFRKSTMTTELKQTDGHA